MSDFSGQSTLKYDWSYDENTNLVTIVVKDALDVTLDTLIIERNRCRTFLESFGIIAREMFTDLDNTLQGSKLTFNKNTGAALLEFG